MATKRTDYIWFGGEMTPQSETKVHVTSYVLYYGTSVFEGIHCYDSCKGLVVFCYHEYMQRLHGSVKIYRFPVSQSVDELTEAYREVIRTSKLTSAYTRPLAFVGDVGMGVNPPDGHKTGVITAAFPWGAYLGAEALEQGIDAMVSSWSHVAPSTISTAVKAGGNYLFSLLVDSGTRRRGYQEGIALGVNGYISEGTGEDPFEMKDGVLLTPPFTSSALPGIIRDAIIKLAEDLGIGVREQVLSREPLYLVDEVFMSGTAVEITPVHGVNGIQVGAGRRGPVTKRIQKAFFGPFADEIEDKWGWLDPVNKQLKVGRHALSRLINRDGSKKNMPKYRFATTTHSHNMVGVRALWRATGMIDVDFDKPIIAVVSSFTQFVPGHVHLRGLDKLVAEQIEAAGGVAKEFNTTAVDDRIVMDHGSMLYSLLSRELIVDSVEYMANAYCADAMVCISNYDKITPGMLMASLHPNIPVTPVFGDPTEAGRVKLSNKVIKLDLVDAMIWGADPKVPDEQSNQVERSVCPTCSPCSGMFTVNSMNYLAKAPGLSQPGNGSLLATRADRKELLLNADKHIMKLTKRYYKQNDTSTLLRGIASRVAFENAITLDIATGSPTNTVSHLLTAVQEVEIDFTVSNIDKLSRKAPQLCKVVSNTQKYHMEDVYRADGVLGILGELDYAGLLSRDVKNVPDLTLPQILEQYDVTVTQDDAVKKMFRASLARIRTTQAFSQDCHRGTLDDDRAEECICSLEHAYSKDGGLVVLYGNFAENGCIVKTASVDDNILKFTGPAKVYESQDEAVDAVLGGEAVKDDVVIIRYERPRDGPGMQEMFYSTTLLKSMGLGKACALVTDGCLSGGTSGLSIDHVSPGTASGGNIAIIGDGDMIIINIPNRDIQLQFSDAEIAAYRETQKARGDKAWTPKDHERQASFTPRAYASFTTNADKGAVRDRSKLGD